MRKIRKKLARMCQLLDCLESQDIATLKGKILILTLYAILENVQNDCANFNATRRNLNGHEEKRSTKFVNNSEVK